MSKQQMETIVFHSFQTFSAYTFALDDAVDTVVCAPDDGWKYHPKT
jgi:hypothetical protein